VRVQHQQQPAGEDEPAEQAAQSVQPGRLQPVEQCQAAEDRGDHGHGGCAQGRAVDVVPAAPEALTTLTSEMMLTTSAVKAMGGEVQGPDGAHDDQSSANPDTVCT